MAYETVAELKARYATSAAAAHEAASQRRKAANRKEAYINKMLFIAIIATSGSALVKSILEDLGWML